MDEYFSLLMNGLIKEEPAHSDEFPFEVKKRKLSDYSSNLIHCHWHPNVQLTYIMKGSMTCQVNSLSFKMTEGSCLFINSDALHILKPSSTAPDCEFISFMWNPAIISGGETFSIFHNYIEPICFNNNISGLYFEPTSSFVQKSYPRLLETAAILQAEHTGYELFIMEHLCALWPLLFEEARSYIGGKESSILVELYRLKSGLSFIQQHYKENVSLQDISNACQTSKSECCHLFKSILGESPISLLSNYRIQASLLLLLNEKKSMNDISAELGFHGSSYFSETFKKIMKCSPRDYRKLCLNQPN